MNRNAPNFMNFISYEVINSGVGEYVSVLSVLFIHAYGQQMTILIMLPIQVIAFTCDLYLCNYIYM